MAEVGRHYKKLKKNSEIRRLDEIRCCYLFSASLMLSLLCSDGTLPQMKYVSLACNYGKEQKWSLNKVVVTLLCLLYDYTQTKNIPTWAPTPFLTPCTGICMDRTEKSVKFNSWIFLNFSYIWHCQRFLHPGTRHIVKFRIAELFNSLSHSKREGEEGILAWLLEADHF